MVLGTLSITLGIVFLTSLYLGRKFFEGGKCRIKKDLSDKVIIVTGSNTGIGKETARELARMGATVILACRHPEKTAKALKELQIDTQNKKIEMMDLDLSDFSSIKRFADEFKKKYDKLDVLINNASIYGLHERTITKDGFEETFQTNYLGPFYLTNQLLDLIKKSAPSRIINLSSMLHHAGKLVWDDLDMQKRLYDSANPYNNSKFAMTVFTKELQRRLDENSVKVVCLHPGAVDTPLYRYWNQIWWKRLLVFIMKDNITRYFWKNPHQGAQTSIYCTVEDFAKLQGGAYYRDCKVGWNNPRANDKEKWTKLWDITEKLIAGKAKQ